MHYASARPVFLSSAHLTGSALAEAMLEAEAWLFVCLYPMFGL